MAYQFSLLNRKHVDAITDVVQARSEFSGVKGDALENVKSVQRLKMYNALDDVVVASGMARIYGVFEGERLLSVMFTTVSEQQANYYITRWHGRPGMHSKEVLQTLWSGILDDYESLGYFRFMTLYQKKHVRAYYTMGGPEGRGYISYNELELPPDTAPKQVELWDKLYGRTLFPHETVVRAFVKPRGEVVMR